MGWNAMRMKLLCAGVALGAVGFAAFGTATGAPASRMPVKADNFMLEDQHGIGHEQGLGGRA